MEKKRWGWAIIDQDAGESEVSVTRRKKEVWDRGKKEKEGDMSEARSIMASLAPVPEMWQMGSPCAHVGGRRLRQSRLCLTLLWHLLLSSLARLASAQDDGGDMGDDGSSMVDPSLLMEDDTLAGMGMGGPGGGRAGLSLSLEVRCGRKTKVSLLFSLICCCHCHYCSYLSY